MNKIAEVIRNICDLVNHKNISIFNKHSYDLSLNWALFDLIFVTKTHTIIFILTNLFFLRNFVHLLCHRRDNLRQPLKSIFY